MRVAVSGINGFVGHHLLAELVGRGHQVVGIGMGPASLAVTASVTHYVAQDLTQSWPGAALDGIDAVVHLAGLSAVGPSFADPQRYLTTNSAVVTHLGEQLLRQARRPRVVVVSTGAVYAPGVGIKETSPLRASSPYAVSKLVVETQCEYYRSRGLDIVVMRPFNHLGPGQQGGFLLPDLVAGVRRGPLVVGDLSTRRDYTDVRDVVRAYRLAVEAPEIAEPVLNVCSGMAVSGTELLETVVEQLGVPQPEVVVDPDRIRPSDPKIVSGDSSAARHALGWRPEVELDRTVRDYLDDLMGRHRQR